MPEKKIILFGGTFDPIHVGHTTVIAFALEQIGAEKVIFIPAKQSPLKMFSPKISNEDRMKIITLAICENQNFELSDHEIKKSGFSYTLETVRYFHSLYSEDVSLYWLTGADSLDELSHWYGILDLIDECNLSVMYRAGCKEPDFSRFMDAWGQERVEKLQRNVIKTPLIDISSTQIRDRLAKGMDVSGMLHPAVIDYIADRRLYRSA